MLGTLFDLFPGEFVPKSPGFSIILGEFNPGFTRLPIGRKGGDIFDFAEFAFVIGPGGNAGPNRAINRGGS